MRKLDPPIILTIGRDQIQNPPVMGALHGAHCPRCGYECSSMNPTPTDLRHWCRLRRIAIAFVRWTNNGRLGAIKRNDAEMQPSFIAREMAKLEEKPA